MASKHANSPSPSPSLRSAEEDSPQRPTKRAKRAPGILASHRIFILQAKLSHTEISEIFDLAERADADVVSSPDDADIVITAIGMRKRLERHLDWNLAVSCRICEIVYGAFDQPGNDDHNSQKRKALVTPDWLRDSVAQARPLPCADYAALPDLKATNEKVCRRGGSLPSEKPLSKFKSRSPFLQDTSPHSRSSYRATHKDIVPPAFLLPPPVPPPPAELDHTARYCCSRASPLVCVNQPLCAALDVLRRSRALESNEHSALSYARAIAVSIALPTSSPSLSTFILHRLSKVLMYASCNLRISAYWVVSVSAKDHGQGARGSTETTFHWDEGLQDGMLRDIGHAFVYSSR